MKRSYFVTFGARTKGGNSTEFQYGWGVDVTVEETDTAKNILGKIETNIRVSAKISDANEIRFIGIFPL